MTEVLTRAPDPAHPLRHPIVAVGNFDGVHLGHQAIMAQVVRRAREIGGTSVVLTFEPHPIAVLRPETDLKLLTTLDQKVELMDRAGIDLVVALPFTPEFARRSAEEFVREDLVAGLGAREVYVGKNFGFGKGREGRADDLQRFAEALGVGVVIWQPVLVNGAMVSSSTVRRLLEDGRVAEVSALLGRCYATDGMVAHGEGRGRALGYPTANLQPGAHMLPKIGIYAAVVDDLTSGERDLDAVVYIGSQPTFGPHQVQVEAHLLNRSVPRYDHRLRITFRAWIRGEQRFPNPEALVQQITLDVAAAHTALSKQAAPTTPPG